MSLTVLQTSKKLFNQVLNSIHQSWKDNRAYVKAYRGLRLIIDDSLKDGEFTQASIKRIKAHMKEHGLPETLLHKLRMNAFNSAYSVMRSDNRITDKETQDLERLKGFFGLTDNDIQHTRPELERLQLLAEIDEGRIPSLHLSNVMLQKGETAYWQANSTWKEEQVIERNYVGGSHGVSLRIAKGISYRVGSSRGQLVTKTGMVPVAFGQFIITNKRLIFAGNAKSFQIPYAKVINMELYTDGLMIQTGVGKGKLVVFDEPFGDVVGSLTTYAINHNS